MEVLGETWSNVHRGASITGLLEQHKRIDVN